MRTRRTAQGPGTKAKPDRVVYSARERIFGARGILKLAIAQNLDAIDSDCCTALLCLVRDADQALMAIPQDAGRGPRWIGRVVPLLELLYHSSKDVEDLGLDRELIEALDFALAEMEDSLELLEKDLAEPEPERPSVN
ncbi:MAG: hypothetical protein BroJett031_34490 [Betaproteobacteria bacterium]|nr:MAG: hypothetical protein BroJett031_34490 [Betaproteobacteria bacterium]